MTAWYFQGTLVYVMYIYGIYFYGIYFYGTYFWKKSKLLTWLTSVIKDNYMFAQKKNLVIQIFFNLITLI